MRGVSKLLTPRCFFWLSTAYPQLFPCFAVDKRLIQLAGADHDAGAQADADLGIGEQDAFFAAVGEGRLIGTATETTSSRPLPNVTIVCRWNGLDGTAGTDTATACVVTTGVP